MDIYLDASCLGIYPPLFTSPSADSCILATSVKILPFRRRALIIEVKNSKYWKNNQKRRLSFCYVAYHSLLFGFPQLLELQRQLAALKMDLEAKEAADRTKAAEM